MPFDIGSSVNSAADWLCGSALVKGVVSNPIFTALLLTAMVVIVILGMYYREFRDGGKKKMFRMTIFLLLGISAVVFIHYYAVDRCIRTDAAQKGVRDVFQGIEQSRQINPTNVSVLGAGDRPRVFGSPAPAQTSADPPDDGDSSDEEGGDLKIEDVIV